MISLEQIQIASATILSASVGVAIYAMYLNFRINKVNKRADVIMHCNNRYDDIYQFKIHILEEISRLQKTSGVDHQEAIDELSRQYYARYWGLKSDQFDYWLAGWVDIETFSSWFYSTIQHFKSDDPVGNLRFTDGWIEIGTDDHHNVNEWFDELVNEMVKISEAKDPRFTDLVDILIIVWERSARWRRKLRGDMSPRYYRHVLLNKKTLIRRLGRD